MSDISVPTRNNRRITARKACVLTVRYRANDEWHPATAMDISQYGCRLRVGEDIARGSELAVVFEAPDHDGTHVAPVEVAGRAIWARLEGLSFQVGVHFDGSPPGLMDIMSALG